MLERKAEIVGHYKAPGKTILERWQLLNEGRRQSFLKIAGTFVKTLHFVNSRPDIDI